MVFDEKNFSRLQAMYIDLLKATMELNGIKEIKCSNKKEPFFDRVVLNNGNLEVYKYGWKEPLDKLYFDFSVDYAKCMSYIEEDLFLAEHKTTGIHGMSFIFNK